MCNSCRKNIDQLDKLEMRISQSVSILSLLENSMLNGCPKSDEHILNGLSVARKLLEGGKEIEAGSKEKELYLRPVPTKNPRLMVEMSDHFIRKFSN